MLRNTARARPASIFPLSFQYGHQAPPSLFRKPIPGTLREPPTSFLSYTLFILRRGSKPTTETPASTVPKDPKRLLLRSFVHVIPKIGIWYIWNLMWLYPGNPQIPRTTVVFAAPSALQHCKYIQNILQCLLQVLQRLQKQRHLYWVILHICIRKW